MSVFTPRQEQTAAAEEKGLGLCTINCPNDIDFTRSGCDGLSSFNFGEPAFMGECERMSFTYSPPESTFFPVGYHEVIVTAENGATCSFNVIVRTENDSTPPEIACPADITTTAKLGKNSATVNYAVEGTDDCTVALLYEQLAGLPPKAEFPVGTTTNIWRATDASGNTDQCSFNVTVIAAIKVKEPSDTTVFQGLKTPVRWKSGALEGDVRIELRRDGAFVRIIKAATEDDSLFRWRVPTNLPTGTGYTMRISSVEDPTIFDESDEPFRVKSLQ